MMKGVIQGSNKLTTIIDKIEELSKSDSSCLATLVGNENSLITQGDHEIQGRVNNIIIEFQHFLRTSILINMKKFSGMGYND